MGVGGSKRAPHPRALGLASPWLAHSISPHLQKSLGSRVRGSDRELGGPVWGLRVGASSLWLYSLGCRKTQGQLRHKSRENRPNPLMRGVSEQNWTGQGCRDASNWGQFCPHASSLYLLASSPFNRGVWKVYLILQSTLLADRDPDAKNRATEGRLILRDMSMDTHVNSRLSSWEEIKKPFIFLKGSFKTMLFKKTQFSDRFNVGDIFGKTQVSSLTCGVHTPSPLIPHGCVTKATCSTSLSSSFIIWRACSVASLKFHPLWPQGL